ncbi:hypothetical protein PQZ52_02180 [Flavobacteriales bacterium]|nr:hypothetical protein [Flavobacteriales bacterium]
MKKLILTILTTITIWGVNAQGNNLQFNQAIFQEFIFTVPQGYSERFFNAGTITVPQNKVWKITSSSAYCTDINPNDQMYQAGIKINNHLLRFEERSHEPHPIWLNPGNYTIWLANGVTAYQKTIGSISGIEFNLVP